MGYYAYKDSGYTQPFMIQPFALGDTSIGSATDWNNNRFSVGDSECHTSPVSDVWIDYSVIRLSDVNPSCTLYFTSGWTLNLTFSKVSDDSYTITNFGGITSGSTVIAGPTATISENSNSFKILSAGFIFNKCTATVAGFPHNVICVTFGFWGQDCVSGIPFGEPYFKNRNCRAISLEAFTATETDPQGGIPQNPEGGYGSHQLHGENLSFGSISDLNTDTGGGGLAAGNAHGVHLYELDVSAYNDFIETIYGDQGDGFSFGDLWTQFKNSQHDPLSGILGSLIVPLSPTVTSVGYIRLSGQSIKVSGTCNAAERFGETAETTIYIQQYHNSFLDFAPYTTVSLFLPFIGVVGLNTNEVMGGSVSVKYWVDFVTGDCVAYVTCRRADNVDGIVYPTYYQYSGNCAAFRPVSSNDAGISSIISGASSVVGGLLSASAGNVGGVMTAASGLLEVMEPKTNERHTGGFTGGSGCLGGKFPYVMITRPAEAIPTGYTGLMGSISAQSGVIGDYSGFTTFLTADLEGVDASDSELSEIESALKEGVYI